MGMVRAFDVCLHVLKLLFMSHPTFRILTLLLFANPLSPVFNVYYRLVNTTHSAAVPPPNVLLSTTVMDALCV